MSAIGLLRAPADRPVGARGPRAWVAAVVAIAGVLMLGFSENSDDPAWTRAALILAAAALISAAVLVWIARRLVGLGLAAALVAVAIGTWVVAEAAQRTEEREASAGAVSKWGGAVFHYDDKGPAITKAEAEAVPKGATKDEVREMLGPAAGSGIQRVYDGKDLRCVAYRKSVGGRRTGWSVYAFCFTGERYSDLHKW